MKKTRIAINGFGRIGRLVLRALLERSDHCLDIVAINEPADGKVSAHLLAYDSVHGPLNKDITYKNEKLCIGNLSISLFHEKNPQNLPWKDLKVDCVLECSGFFTEYSQAMLHCHAGAGRVLISAPAEGVDRTVVFGVNHESLTSKDKIVSNASCTTNCLAPMAKVLDELLGIEYGYMTTIHSYTGDQRLVDSMHSDLRRARAGALSMIPTSTGAARAVGLVLPHLQGRLDGTAIRVPTANVSLVDFTFVSKKETSPSEINNAMIQSKEGALEGILGINTLPLVSCDFNHCSYSCVFDTTQTQVINNTFCRVLGWYDNEWGFSNRMIDVAQYMGDL